MSHNARECWCGINHAAKPPWPDDVSLKTELELLVLPESCPVCGHTDDHHDENGCDVDGCECTGP